MQIIIDGRKVPVSPKVSKDTTREIVYINTKNSKTPVPIADRPVVSEDETESNRLSGKVICIDPGHGGNDSGAIGPTGTAEKDNNLAIALLLCDKLEKNGATVILTRDTDIEVKVSDASTEAEFGARVDIANDHGADIFISIHKLVEAAFISNPEEEVLLASVDGRYNIADSIFRGIVKYFKV
ncbi:MAG: N-acetylmuramoyl-L-alanine amidase [Anaerospora sp.]|nr:N-acetylmuramoyl-L-alanine amidase [Anaerospora sp.]